MVWPAAVIGGIAAGAGAIGSALIGSNAAGKAADQAADASKAEFDYLRETRDMTRADQAPYVKAGHSALNAALYMVGLPGVTAKPYAGQPNPTPLGTPAQQKMLNDVYNNQDKNNPRRPARFMSSHEGLRRNYDIGNDRNIGGQNFFDGARPNGGPVDGGGNYLVNDGSIGQQETFWPNNGGQPQQIQGGPQAFTPPTDGVISPGTYTPPGGVPENTGGMPGQYNFKADPGYNFRFNEGVRAMDRSAAAKGNLNSGGQFRKMTRYGQDYASGEYQNVYNRIASIAGLAQTAISNNNAVTANLGAQGAGALGDSGYAQAAGTIGQGNSWMRGINDFAQGIGSYFVNPGTGGGGGGGGGGGPVSGSSGSPS